MTGSRGVQPTHTIRSFVSAAARAAFLSRRKLSNTSVPTGSPQSDDTCLASNVLNALPIEIAVLNAHGTIEAVNDAWRIVASRAGVRAAANAFVGTNYIDVCARAARAGSREAGDALAGIKAVLKGDAARHVSRYDMTHGGAEYTYEMQVVPHAGSGAVIMHADVTACAHAEREAAERTRELLHLSRVLTVGSLSGALTHELNQPLTAILANAQAALRMLETGAPDMHVVGETVRDTVRSVQRASEIVRRTRSLLTRGTPRHEEVDINEVVQEAGRMLSNEALLRGVRLTVLRALDLPDVYGDPIQLQQCVINLMINGFDAMAELPQSERHLLVHTARAGRNNVEIVVEDRGKGIDPARMQHIFDPFYTTKRNGMGLGLYITREIVRSHGGRISVKRNPDRGTRFRITLPSAPASNERMLGASGP